MVILLAVYATSAIGISLAEAPKSSPREVRILAMINDNSLKGLASPHLPIVRNGVDINGILISLSAKYGIDYECFFAIIQAESGFEPLICNLKYGCGSGNGLAQIIPNTLKHCEKKLERALNVKDVYDNLECAAWLIKNEGVGHWGNRDSWWGSYNKWKNKCLMYL